MLPLLPILGAVLSGCVDPTDNGRRPEDSDDTANPPDDTSPPTDTYIDDTGEPDTYVDDTGDDTGTLPDECADFNQLWFNPEPFVIEGENSDDASQGLAVAAGDLDGDGVNDLVIGMPNYSVGYYTYDGRVYGVLGGKTVVPGGLISIADAPLKLDGRDWESMFGDSLAISADHLFVGAPGTDSVYVLNPSDFSTQAVLQGSIVGEHLFVIPDVDEATTDDEGNIIPGPGELVVGGSEFAVIPLEKIGSGTQSIDAIMKYYVECPDYQSVDEVSAGDMDGDGLAEVVFGDSDDYYYGTGKAYLVRGGSWPEEGGTVTLWPDGVNRGADFFTVTGNEDVLSVGAALAMGDVDGDDLADLLIGAPGETNGHDYSGGLHKLSSQGGLGSLYGQVMQLGAGGTLSLPQSAAVYGNTDNANLPTSIAVVNDPECPELSAVVAGMQTSDRAFVIGSSTLAGFVEGTNATVDEADQPLGYGVTSGVDADTQFGVDVFSVGDVDGDGAPDVAVTSYGPSDTSKGQVFVFLGERVP